LPYPLKRPLCCSLPVWYLIPGAGGDAGACFMKLIRYAPFCDCLERRGRGAEAFFSTALLCGIIFWRNRAGVGSADNWYKSTPVFASDDQLQKAHRDVIGQAREFLIKRISGLEYSVAGRGCRLLHQLRLAREDDQIFGVGSFIAVVIHLIPLLPRRVYNDHVADDARTYQRMSFAAGTTGERAAHPKRATRSVRWAQEYNPLMNGHHLCSLVVNVFRLRSPPIVGMRLCHLLLPSFWAWLLEIIPFVGNYHGEARFITWHHGAYPQGRWLHMVPGGVAQLFPDPVPPILYPFRISSFSHARHGGGS